MEVKKPKIVLSGAPGTGRGALAKALAEKLGVPVIVDGMTGIAQAEQAYRAARAMATREQKALVSTKNKWVQSFVDWANARGKAYQSSPGFVADRWEADLLNLWLAHFGTQGLDEVTVKLLEDMRKKAGLLDLVIVMPMKNPASKDGNGDASKKATPSFTSSFMSSVLTSALVRECPNTRVLMLAKKLTVEQQVAAVEAALAEMEDKTAPADEPAEEPSVAS